MLRGSPARLQSLIGQVECPAPAQIFSDMIAAQR